ncbi:UNVERIFIED_CONTAM: hypothetical protein GTU68_010413 [Idotea baltica]|nr:hypothetical protein [Idotea baltica]
MATPLVLYGSTVATVVGYPEHRHSRDAVRVDHGCAGGFSSGAKHNAERNFRSPHCTASDRFNAVDQFADLGLVACGNSRPRYFCGNDRHCDPLNRLLCKASLRGHRRNRHQTSRSHFGHRREPLAGDGLWHRSTSHAGLCRNCGVPVGHQCSRVHCSRLCRGRGDRPPTQGIHGYLGVATGHVDHFRDFRSRHCQRMDFRQGSRSNHLNDS